MATPVNDKVRVSDAAHMNTDSETLSEDQRAFIRSMQQAARGEGQPLSEFLEELRQELQMERADENGSHRNS
ncbi:MAG: hypothetical protein OXE95_05630 [Chloroflexi bacterium]|nr:hypothetical protein [Chloroflexota bacterium]MCY4247042.1 hypothetical protein [Chloroflexota bacterium]